MATDPEIAEEGKNALHSWIAGIPTAQRVAVAEFVERMRSDVTGYEDEDGSLRAESLDELAQWLSRFPDIYDALYSSEAVVNRDNVYNLPVRPSNEIV